MGTQVRPARSLAGWWDAESQGDAIDAATMCAVVRDERG
jgi:hypothetical protein